MPRGARFGNPFGEIRTYTIADPALGAVWGNQVVPSDEVWLITAMSFVVTPDATVIGRCPRIFWGSGGADATRLWMQASIPAADAVLVSLALGWGFADANGAVVGANDRNMGLPFVLIAPGDWFRPDLKWIQAGDQLSLFRAQIMVWRV